MIPENPVFAVLVILNLGGMLRSREAFAHQNSRGGRGRDLPLHQPHGEWRVVV